MEVKSRTDTSLLQGRVAQEGQEGMRMGLAEGDGPTSIASQVSWSEWSTPAICEGSSFLWKDLVPHPSFLLPW